MGLEDHVKDHIPVGRMGTRLDIANGVVYMCSDAAAGFITGETLVIDGGHRFTRPDLRAMMNSKM